MINRILGILAHRQFVEHTPTPATIVQVVTEQALRRFTHGI